MKTTDIQTMTPATRDRWLESPGTAQAVAAAIATGARYFEGEHNRSASVPAGASIPAFWPTQIAKHWRSQVEADRISIGNLAVGEGLAVATATHPRHGYHMVTVWRLA